MKRRYEKLIAIYKSEINDCWTIEEQDREKGFRITELNIKGEILLEEHFDEKYHKIHEEQLVA